MTPLPVLTRTMNRICNSFDPRDSKALRVSWDITDKNADFECTYIVQKGQKDNQGPYSKLLVTQINVEDPWWHMYMVRTRNGVLCTNSYLGDDYKRLMDIIGIASGPGDPWKPENFLKKVDEGSWNAAYRRIIRASELPRRFFTDVEEEDKTIFIGLRHNPVGQSQTRENWNKTAQVFSKGFADECRAANMSTCWTDRLKEGQHELPIPEHVTEVSEIE